MTQPPDDELPGMWEQADFIDTRDAPPPANPTPHILCEVCDGQLTVVATTNPSTRIVHTFYAHTASLLPGGTETHLAIPAISLKPRTPDPSPPHTGNTVPLEDFVHMVQQLAYEDGVPREDLPGFTPDPIHPPTQGS